MLQLKVIEYRALRDDVFKENSEGRNVPLSVTQLIDQAPLCFGGEDAKGLIERAIRTADAKGSVENEKRLAYCVDDVLGKVLDVFPL